MRSKALIRSARACFEISCRQLSPAARDLLERACVLPGGAGPALLDALTGGGEWDESAEELVAASVWRYEGGRYLMHPLLRRFALEEVGERRPVLEREAVAALTGLAREKGAKSEPGRASPEQAVAALDWMEREWRNILACARLAEAMEDWNSVAALVSAVRFFFLVRGRWAESENLFRLWLEASRSAGDRSGEAAAVNSLANICISRHQYEQAEALYREALGIREELGDRAGMAIVLNNLGIVHAAREEWQSAEEAYQRAASISREIGDRTGEASTLNGLASIHFCLRRWDEAERTLRAALEVWRELGDRLGEAKALNNLGAVLQALEKWEEAERCLEESLAIRRQMGDCAGEGATLTRLANLLEAKGDLSAALESARRAVALLPGHASP